MKQRKPILALLVAAALLPWLTVSVRAADTDVMFSDPSVVVGNTVTVNVYTTSAVAGIDLTLVYDTDYLTYTGASGGLGNAAVQDNGGSLRIVDYSGSGEGKFSLNLSFTARAIGTTALRPTACSASNAGGDAVSVEYASHSASVTITSASSDCTLSALYIDPGTLSPAFSANVTNYAVTVPYETTWLAVSAVKNDASAATAVSGNGSLSVGLNYVTVTVTAGNGAQRVYTLAVTRQAQDTAAQPTSDNHVDTTEPEIPEATPAAGRTIFTAEGRTYTILDAAMLSVRPPEGCVLGEYALLGSVCRAYLPEESTLCSTRGPREASRDFISTIRARKRCSATALSPCRRRHRRRNRPQARSRRPRLRRRRRMLRIRRSKISAGRSRCSPSPLPCSSSARRCSARSSSAASPARCGK